MGRKELKKTIKKDFTGRLPSGETTSSIPKFDKEWKDFNFTLEMALGMQVIGFDPGVLLGNPSGNGGYHGTVNLPMSVARKIVELYENRCTCEPQWGD